MLHLPLCAWRHGTARGVQTVPAHHDDIRASRVNSQTSSHHDVSATPVRRRGIVSKCEAGEHVDHVSGLIVRVIVISRFIVLVVRPVG